MEENLKVYFKKYLIMKQCIMINILKYLIMKQCIMINILKLKYKFTMIEYILIVEMIKYPKDS